MPNAWNVTFIHDYFTLTTTVVLPESDADSWELANTADAVLRDVAGFSVLELGCAVSDIEELGELS